MRRLLPILLTTIIGSAAAQDVGAPTSPLAIRQQHVQRMMDELERKFITLKLALSQNEPERAERLQEALNRAKELLLQKRMAEVAAQLNRAQLDAAGENQKALLADIRQLLTFLLEETAGRPSAAEELQRLQEWKAQIERLAGAERKLQQQVDNLPTEPSQAALDPLAQAQADLARQTGALSQQMRVQQPGDSAGQQPLTAAQSAMQQASQHLARQQAKEASQQQTDAIRQLLAAIKEVEQRASELRRQEQSETLAKLSAHFSQMLDQQRRLTSETAALHAKRSATEGQLSRGDRNTARALGHAERSLEPLPGSTEPGLAGKAQAGLDLLAGEISGVLVSLVEQLRDDLIAVGNRLADELETGERTAALQVDIEATLESLAEALDQARQSAEANQPSDAGDSASQQGKKAALPTSAELKLLRAAQLQINRRTTAIDHLRSQLPTDDQLASETQKLAQRQATLAAQAAEIAKRQEQ